MPNSSNELVRVPAEPRERWRPSLGLDPLSVLHGLFLKRPYSQEGPLVLGQPFCITAKSTCPPRGVCYAWKLESDPWGWRQARSPWQLWIYYRGLHLAGRTWDLRLEEREPSVTVFCERPQSPTMVSEGPVPGWGGPVLKSFPDCPLSTAGQVFFPGPD